MELTHRTCTGCSTLKSVDAFATTTRKTPDGRVSKCRECISVLKRAYYIKSIERIRERQRKFDSLPHRVVAHRTYRTSSAGKETAERARRKAIQKHPEKFRARAAAAHAARTGKIEKLPCRECGSLKVEAHHPDYSRPLEVIWLCQRHHNDEHQRLKRAKR